MNKHSGKIFKMAAVALIFALFVLAGCAQSLPATICHATGDATTPYEVLTITTEAQAREHLAHPNDIFATPAGGCPTTLVLPNNGKIAICHATSSQTHPYRELIVKVNGLNGHATHANDIVPAPEGGCPTSPLVIVADQISICHATGIETAPYEEITVNVNGLDGHAAHMDDIVPAPVGGCPTSPLVIVDGKISICHVTSRKTNPYNLITVSVNGLNGHVTHEGDIIPAPETGCPNTLLDIVDNKITICHATNSEKNPYNLITVSVNGLNGHSKHAGDIIPAVAGSCPTTKQ
jgi:hypothetical protein